MKQPLNEQFKRMQELAGITEENNPRFELHRIVKGILIAAKSTSYDAEAREKALEKELEDLMKKHPEFTEEMVEKVQNDIAMKQPINEVKRMQQLAGLITESSAFNDAGEPMMTHNQFRDYSEPSENDEDDGYDNDEIDISREFINEMKKNNIFVETFNGEEYFIRCKQLNIGEYEDFTIYFPNDETILIYDTRNNEQEQEFGYQGAVDYVLENKGHLLTFDESVKQRDSEMDIDSQDRKNNRAEMGGYGLG